MKHTTIRLFSLLLTLVMLLGTVPFAAAACADGCTDLDADLACDICSEPISSNSNDLPIDTPDPEDPEDPEDPAKCQHTETVTNYIARGDGTHVIEVTCTETACGLIVKTDAKMCYDLNRDDECDMCHAEIPDYAERCDHLERATVVTPLEVGKHLAQAICSNPDCSAVIGEATYNCADADTDGKCDKCYQDMPVASKFSISCPQDGAESSSDSMNLSFELLGSDTDDISWTFSASGSSDPELSSYSGFGTQTSLTVTANNGQGVAKIIATAKVEDETVSKTVYVSFFERASITVQVKDGLKSFRFTQTKVFSQAPGFRGDRVEDASLYSYLTDGYATRIVLHENNRNNAAVGNVTCKLSGNFSQYDPKDYNDYNITNLQSVYFNIMGEGSFKLNFELYEMAGSTGLTTTSGTITIVVGQAGSGDPDIIFRTDGSPITFGNDVFTTYWDEHAASKSEKLNYVKFSVDSRNYGALYLDKSQRGMVSPDYKMVPNYKKEAAKSYELGNVTYVPNPNKESYTDQIDFVAYGKGNSVLRGTVTIIVGGEKLNFTDVQLTDWFYGNVQYVVEEGIMNGTSATTFSPNGTLTRGMVVTMLYRAAGEPFTTADIEFTDVADDVWYANAVAWASANGIVEGVGDGKFAPDASITREQLATILYRYAKSADMSTVYGSISLDDFKDGKNVSAYAEDSMRWAVYEKIMQGSDNNLNPKNTATRAEAAAMFERFLK